MSNESTPSASLTMLRNAVRAQAVYWDALTDLELNLSTAGEFSDRANNAVVELIATLATGAKGDMSNVTDEHVQRIVQAANL